MQNYCTIYSHEIGLDQIVAAIQAVFPQAETKISEAEDSKAKVVQVAVRKGLLGTKKKFQLAYRERAKPSYQITEIDSPLTSNLTGMLSFVTELKNTNEQVKELLIQKIKTINCECAVHCSPLVRTMLTPFIEKLIQQLDAIIFAQGKIIIGKSKVQQFLDKNLNLILDMNGKSEIDTLEVNIHPKYFDAPQENISEDQKKRKTASEEILKAHQIKINSHLPFIASETNTTIRSPREIAERVAVLAITNMVAFGEDTGEEALKYIKHHRLLDKVSPKELEFLKNPTDELRARETWRCESIWTLMWALRITKDLGFPDEVANLDKIPPKKYPIGKHTTPNEFIKKIKSSRSKTELLNANDLYYRINWACLDARIAGKELEIVNPGTVYERNYALNWLINYKNQAWDDVTCDT